MAGVVVALETQFFVFEMAKLRGWISLIGNNTPGDDPLVKEGNVCPIVPGLRVKGSRRWLKMTMEQPPEKHSGEQ